MEVLISKAHKRENVSDSYKTPIINLSSIEFTLEESKQLNLCLEYSFVDKNKNVKKFLATNFKSIADRIPDNIQSDLRENYQEMLPKSNQPGQLHGTAKTHKFTNIDEIIVDNLKFRPIIAQTGTYNYNAAQVTAKYCKSLCSGNNYIIRNMLEISMFLKE